MCKYICAYMCPLFLSPTYLSAKIMLILIKFKLCLSKADEVPRPNPRMAGPLRVVDGPNIALYPMILHRRLQQERKSG